MIRKGGTAVMVGMTRADAQVTIPTFDLFFNEKTLKGCKYGSGQVRRDFQRFVDLIETGRLDTGAMVSRTIKLDDVNDAFRAMEKRRSHPQRHHDVLTSRARRRRADARGDRGAACGRASTRANGRTRSRTSWPATGETVTYRELNDRSNQLAQLFCDGRAALRRPHRGLDGEPARVLRGLLGRAALGPVLHGDQLALHRRRSRVHPRRLRRAGARDLRRRTASSRPSSRDKMPNVKHPAHGRRATRSTATSRTPTRATAIPPSRWPRSSRARRCSTRRARPAGRRASSTRSNAEPIGDHARARWACSPRSSGMDERQRVPVARAAVPLGAALLLHEHDAARRHRDRAWSSSIPRTRSR